MNVELKPCPFCGGEAVATGGEGYAYIAKCTICGISTAKYISKENAIEKWNKRTDGWIKITPDTLPEDECIALGQQNEMIIGYIGEDGEDSETGYFAENDGEVLYNVTRWMPKPSLPKG